MRSIKARFQIEEQKSPYHGACVNLAKAVRGKYFSRRALIKALSELVPEGEYEKSDIFQLVNFLEEVSNTTEEVEKGVENRLDRE